MSVSIQGNVALEGISIGKIVKVDQSLDGYVASYTPGTAEEELAKLEAALEAISAEIDESVEKMQPLMKVLRP